jgi:hypothetical protein
MREKRLYGVLAVMLLALPAEAQAEAPPSRNLAQARPAVSSTSQVAGPGDVLPLLGQIQAAARTTTADVSLLNIRKWKVGNDAKGDAQTKAEAIQRNLTVALPAIVSQVQASPNDFAANFKLYRNLGVLYDVMASLAESAGAFGSKNEFEPLVNDLNRIDQTRRLLGERLEALASAKDAEIAQLQHQVRAARSAASTKPKKIIVDDNENGHKKPLKKTPQKKPSTATQASPKQPGNPQ